MACCGGGVGVGFLLQQQLDELLVAHPGGTMQRGLVILAREERIIRKCEALPVTSSSLFEFLTTICTRYAESKNEQRVGGKLSHRRSCFLLTPGISYRAF